MINGFTLLGIEMIIMICISKLLLKYEYFKHHLISIIIFVLIGIICDIILDNFNNIDSNFFIINSNSNKFSFIFKIIIYNLLNHVI